MEQINLREIPNFFDFENTVKNDGKLDISELCTFLKEKVPIFVIPNIQGNMEDKVRLLCICSLCKDREGKKKRMIDELQFFNRLRIHLMNIKKL